MKPTTNYKRYTWFVLIFVFIVILAGGVVRTTQSGMGCPDWPTCFGRWIPPTDVNQLPPDYEKYLRQQDIDHTFNAYHTWIEYINRLLGALLGVFIFIHLVWSYRLFRKTKPSIFYLSFLLLLATGFQGWLGKKVVDANLAVVKITTHMIVALIIAAIPVIILARLKENKTVVPRSLKLISVVALALVIVQIVLGTEVREQVDEVSRALLYGSRDTWIGRLDKWFLVHRSFSWLVAASGIYLFIRTRPYPELRPAGLLIGSMVLLAISAGLLMNFLDVPPAAQPVHLMAASILSISLLSLRLRMK
ncbi:MAG: heme A synthase [Chitinophagaceae bacterium]|nr:MAG: heme A synthase [Chitinophagaceae bacterium]